MLWKALATALIAVAVMSAVFSVREIKNKEDIVVGTGTVMFLGFEGGFYGIVSDDGQRYDPWNLDKEFRVVGLRVYFEGRILRDVSSFHMWGTIILILKIRRTV